MLNRREVLRQITVGAAAGSRLGARPWQSPPDRPNIILCMADDQGWGDTGYNGHPYLKTPHLDTMSGAGLRFDRFYSGAPVCSPTRGSALTGRHPFRYGIYHANVGHMKKEEATLAEALKTQGYTTGHFGKWHLGTLSPTYSGKKNRRPEKHYSTPGHNGFDEWFSTEYAVPTWDPYTRDECYYVHNGERATENLSGDDSRIIMDRAVPFIRKAVRESKPFFAVIWFHAPHSPVVAGPRYKQMYGNFSEGEQNFYGCITALDEQMGRLRKQLRELGVAGNTMLWYCSDNGPEGRTGQTGNHRGSAKGLRGRKRSLFEGGVRVPGILEWPARVKPWRVTSIPCSTSDYFPTVLDALGFRMKGSPEPVDGISMLPLIDGRMARRPAPIAFQTPDGDERAKAGRLGSPPLALIGNRYKFLSYLDPKRDDEDMLFDLAIDPGERYNLVAEKPDQARSMKARLHEWRESCGRSDAGGDYGTS